MRAHINIQTEFFDGEEGALPHGYSQHDSLLVKEKAAIQLQNTLESVRLRKLINALRLMNQAVKNSKFNKRNDSLSQLRKKIRRQRTESAYQFPEPNIQINSRPYHRLRTNNRAEEDIRSESVSLRSRSANAGSSRKAILKGIRQKLQSSEQPRQKIISTKVQQASIRQNTSVQNKLDIKIKRIESLINNIRRQKQGASLAKVHEKKPMPKLPEKERNGALYQIFIDQIQKLRQEVADLKDINESLVKSSRSRSVRSNQSMHTRGISSHRDNSVSNNRYAQSQKAADQLNPKFNQTSVAYYQIVEQPKKSQEIQLEKRDVQHDRQQERCTFGAKNKLVEVRQNTESHERNPLEKKMNNQSSLSLVKSPKSLNFEPVIRKNSIDATPKTANATLETQYTKPFKHDKIQMENETFSRKQGYAQLPQFSTIPASRELAILQKTKRYASENEEFKQKYGLDLEYKPKFSIESRITEGSRQQKLMRPTIDYNFKETDQGYTSPELLKHLGLSSLESFKRIEPRDHPRSSAGGQANNFSKKSSSYESSSLVYSQPTIQSIPSANQIHSQNFHSKFQLSMSKQLDHLHRKPSPPSAKMPSYPHHQYNFAEPIWQSHSSLSQISSTYLARPSSEYESSSQHRPVSFKEQIEELENRYLR